jgi:HD-GYP domain-containing protein (c-di-GMP phosphodiesterase class II)
VALTSAKLAQSLGFDDKGKGQVFRAAMLHDLGKIAIPHEILRAKSPISEGEEQAYRQHVLATEEYFLRWPPLRQNRVFWSVIMQDEMERVISTTWWGMRSHYVEV